MIKVVLLALTLILASSLTVTNTFNGPIGAVRGPPMVAIPHYPLGNLKTGDTISVTFNMPKPVGTDTLSLITAVAVVDSAYSVVATPTFTLGVLTGLTQGTVTGADAIPADGAHYLRVTGSGSNINAVEIEIRINGVVKFRYADMIRRNLGYYIRLNSAITQSVTVDSTISAGNTGYYEIILGGSGFTFSSFAGDRTSSTVASGSFTESAAMGAGARAISPYWAAQTAFPVKITYQTDPYLCPYDLKFYDYYGAFAGCFFRSAHQDYVIQAHRCGTRQYFLNGTCFDVDLSCNTFNPLNGSCLTCWPNSRRTDNGLCTQATTTRTVPFCYPGTHLFQSICIPDACLAALPNGVCTACVNTAFKLTSDGQCIEIDCSIGLYFSVALDQCAFWPPRCLAMSALTQKCTKCFEGFFPDSNGVCTSPCPAGRFFVNNDCYLLPPRCLSLSNVLHCQKCEEGYRLIQGECTLCNGPNPLFPCVFCPLDHFVSTLGQCVRTARFCDSIDQATGLCLTCASGAIPVEGVCCGFGQALQNGVCVDGSLSINGGQNSQQSQNQNQNQVPQFDSTYYRHCKIYSPPLNKCIECRNGHNFSLTPQGSDLCL